MSERLPKGHDHGRCEARVLPSHLAKMQRCSQPARRVIDGRCLCNRHADVVMRRLRLRAGGAP